MSDRPKLILLNGPLGSGKSTLAAMYAERHDMALALDIDSIWAMMGRWRENKDKSSPQAKALAEHIAAFHLASGYDVIIPQILQTPELVERFEAVAKDADADFYEILLDLSVEEAIKRFIKRGQASGNPNGFRPGGIVDTGGREKLLEEYHRQMTLVAESRPNTIKIVPELGSPDKTLQEIESAVNA